MNVKFALVWLAVISATSFAEPLQKDFLEKAPGLLPNEMFEPIFNTLFADEDQSDLVMNAEDPASVKRALEDLTVILHPTPVVWLRAEDFAGASKQVRLKQFDRQAVIFVVTGLDLISAHQNRAFVEWFNDGLLDRGTPGQINGRKWRIFFPLSEPMKSKSKVPPREVHITLWARLHHFLNP